MVKLVDANQIKDIEICRKMDEPTKRNFCMNNYDALEVDSCKVSVFIIGKFLLVMLHKTGWIFSSE